MLERPPGGATMRWPVRLGLLSSIWAPERHRADHLSPAPLAPPEGRAGTLSRLWDAEPQSWLGPDSPTSAGFTALCSVPLGPRDHSLAAPKTPSWFLSHFLSWRRGGRCSLAPAAGGLGASAWGWAWSTQQCYLQLSEEEFEAPLLLLGRHP